MKNKSAQELGKRSWEKRSEKIKDKSKYFSDLAKGKKPQFDNIEESVAEQD